MIRLDMKNYNLILTEKQQKYQHYHQFKLINMNILQVKKYYLLIKTKLKNKSSLHILLKQKVLKNKEKRLKMELRNKGKRLKMHLKIKPKALQNLNADQQLKSIGNLFPKDFLTVGSKYQLVKIKKIEREINRNNLIHKTGN